MEYLGDEVAFGRVVGKIILNSKLASKNAALIGSANGSLYFSLDVSGVGFVNYDSDSCIRCQVPSGLFRWQSWTCLARAMTILGLSPCCFRRQLPSCVIITQLLSNYLQISKHFQNFPYACQFLLKCSGLGRRKLFVDFLLIQRIDQQNYPNMLETEHEEFEEPDYPSFPVVFQRDLDAEFKQQKTLQALSRSRNLIAVPEHDANALLRLSDNRYETKYPHLFQGTAQLCLADFFHQYLPIDESYVQQMKQQIGSLQICKLGSNKIYVGKFLEGKCCGKSIVIFKNGNLYEGEMKDNKRHGKGTYVHVNSGWYKGNFKEDLKNGQGIEAFYHKSVYRGNFLGGLRHDRGLYVDEDKNIYQGEWRMGIMHGQGTLKTNKSTYSGTFVNFLKHGHGQETFINGDTYQGQYQNGRFDGTGTYTWVAEEATYEGGFKNGLRHGKGKWLRGQTKYSGGYVEGLKEGYGQLYYESGNFYKGNFLEDKKEGYGEMFWSNSSFYKGEWKRGTQNGKGQAYQVGGDIVSGIFENSMLVQAIPSIYEKQMEISNMHLQDMMGTHNKPQVERVTTRTRSISGNKGLPKNKRNFRVDNSGMKRKITGNSSVHNKLYEKSPHKSDHSDGGHHRQCTRCQRRMHNFELKEKTGLLHNHSHSKEHHSNQPTHSHVHTHVHH